MSQTSNPEHTIKAIINGTIYTPQRIVPDGVVLCQGARILAVGKREDVPVAPDAESIDAAGGIVCPGLVDIHVHGGDGADFTDGSAAAVRTVARRHLRAGTTSLLATTASAPLEDIWRAFDSIAAVMRHPEADEARVLGIHMEGPFFALSQRGAHPSELLRMPTEAERERLLGYAGDLVAVSLAPEREGALELIAALNQRGVLVCGGHSDALYRQVCDAMQAGLRHIVHLWSGMSMVRRIGPKRHAGMLEAALVEDGLTGEIIADGYHLPSSLMKLAYRMKGAERLCLVSDAMRASGLGPGEYALCGTTAIVEPGAGVAVTRDRTAFAGSISTVGECLRHLVHVVGISLGDALTMATTTPARIVGVGDRIGRLAPGYPADLLVLDPASLHPRIILRGGRVVEGC
ncbi:MAG: N-acetylglucosamine-6-phosphate deacetylase [Anaerolineae bacterium]